VGLGAHFILECSKYQYFEGIISLLRFLLQMRCVCFEFQQLFENSDLVKKPSLIMADYPNSG